MALRKACRGIGSITSGRADGALWLADRNKGIAKILMGYGGIKCYPQR